MAAIDVVNRVFRNFYRYTGDGKPGEPTNAPLPVGDPQSGVHNPEKSELRTAFLETINAAAASADEAEAWAAAAGLVAVPNGSLTAAKVTNDPTALAAFRDKVIQGGATSALVYLRASTDAVSRTASDKLGEMFSVKDFGAKGDGATNDSAAFTRAYAALPASGGTILVPAGRYVIPATLIIDGTKPLTLIGQGMYASTILLTGAAGDGLVLSSMPLCSVHGMGFIGTVDRTKGDYNLHVKDVATALVTECWFRNTLGGLLFMDNCNTTLLSNLSGACNKNSSFPNGDTCLRLHKSSGTFSNIVFRTGGASGFGRGPCLHVTGPITSMNFSACTFAGAGPTRTINNGAINSTSTNFTINTSGNHGLQVGDFVVIRGATPAAYNNAWRVASIPSANQIAVDSVINPGSASVPGRTEGLMTCAYVTNVTGPCNESQFTGCLFEGLALTTYGSVGLYMEARDAYLPGNRAPLEGWNLNGNYYDFGATGLLLHGHNEAISTLPTVYGININGGMFASFSRCVHLENVCGITINNITCSMYLDTVPDGVWGISSAVYIRGNPSVIATRGITITGSNIGMNRAWSPSVNSWSYYAGITLDGSGLKDIVVVGNNVYGTNAAFYDGGGALAGAVRLVRANNNELTGAL